MTEAEHDAKALSDVNTYGCHVIKVMAEGNLPQFAYSIGIEATSQQPDLLVTGLNLDFGHSIINDYNERVREGERFVPNQPYNGFLEGFPVFFSPMLKEHYHEHVGWGFGFTKATASGSFSLSVPIHPGVGLGIRMRATTTGV